MNKIISLAFFAGGIALFVCGIHATNSLGSDFSRFFNGTPTDKSVWLLIAGFIVTAIGAGGLLGRSKSSE